MMITDYDDAYVLVQKHRYLVIMLCRFPWVAKF